MVSSGSGEAAGACPEIPILDADGRIKAGYQFIEG
jgi:hypothetical protein